MITISNCTTMCMKSGKNLIIAILLLIIFALGYYIYFLTNKSENTQKNSYDYSFSELVNNVNNIENYLAKVMISKSPKHSTDTLTKIWADSNLAVVYIENIPFDKKGSQQSIKFLNQVSDYCYTLSRKTIREEELNDNDFENLKKIYKYARDLKDTVNQISYELYAGQISWDDLKEKSKLSFEENENINVFAGIEGNFDDYEGLIYDGAYSDYIVNEEKLGLTGENISKEDAENKLKSMFESEGIETIEYVGDINGDIEAYIFDIKLERRAYKMEIEISKKGGWIVEIIANKEVKDAKISNEEAIKNGKNFLEKIGYNDMKETYSLRESNVLTINYAYEENSIIIYPDLIKVKIALDDGEILGIEALGYLNAHTKRDLYENIISSEQAKEKLNYNIQIKNERMAVIPLENKTEAYCYEFEGSIEDKQFLIYINAESRRRRRNFNYIRNTRRNINNINEKLI